MEKNNFKHTPIMLNECIDGLNIKPNGIYVDGTLGGAGHSSVIVSKLTTGKLIGIDKDDDALNSSKERLKDYDNVIFVKSDFKKFKSIMENLEIEKVDGILLDLGVSSYQIDTAERGFSYRFNGKLDMRMDKTQSLSAYEVVNNYPVEKLTEILFKYGEEQNSKKIAREIERVRKIKPIETTDELVSIVESCYPKKFYTGVGVCKKTFQAIRIEVNNELGDLDTVITDMVNSLNPGGRLAIITFHSLEDRIVKLKFKELSTDCICDKNVPICTCHHKAEIKLVNKKPIEASDKEQKENRRSLSAKLRIVEKI